MSQAGPISGSGGGGGTELSISPYIVDKYNRTGSNYTTIASALAAAEAAGLGTDANDPIYICIRPGNYGESLTLSADLVYVLFGVSDASVSGAAAVADTTSIDASAAAGLHIQSLQVRNTFTGPYNSCVVSNAELPTCTISSQYWYIYNSEVTSWTFGDVGVNGEFYIQNSHITVMGTTFSPAASTSQLWVEDCTLGVVSFTGAAINTFFVDSSWNDELSASRVTGTNSLPTHFINCEFGGEILTPDWSAAVIDITGDVYTSGCTLTQPAEFIGSNPTAYSGISEQGSVIHARRVGGDITVGQFDYYLGVTSTAAPRSVTLPEQVPTNKSFIIKDESGGAAAQNITIDTTGAPTIDGAATQTISSNYGSLTVMFDGTNYFIL